MVAITRSIAAKQAEEKSKATRSSITAKKILATPKRPMAPINRSIAAKQAGEENKVTHSIITAKGIMGTPKGTMAPVTRSVAAKLAQQKEDNESPRGRSSTDKEKASETPPVRNTYHRYGPRSCVEKPVKHKTKTKTKKKQFHCIFCNKKRFSLAEPHSSRAVGFLDCESCGAAFTFRVSASLACARDVQATLLAGGDIRWLSAMQGVVSGWWICIARKVSRGACTYRVLYIMNDPFQFDRLALHICIYIEALCTFSFRYISWKLGECWSTHRSTGAKGQYCM